MAIIAVLVSMFLMAAYPPAGVISLIFFVFLGLFSKKD